MAVGRRIGNALLQAMETATAAMEMQQKQKESKALERYRNAQAARLERESGFLDRLADTYNEDFRCSFSDWSTSEFGQVIAFTVHFASSTQSWRYDFTPRSTPRSSLSPGIDSRGDSTSAGCPCYKHSGQSSWTTSRAAGI
jgi:hypothetical protein